VDHKTSGTGLQTPSLPVIDTLQSHLELKLVDDKNALVRAGWRYLQNQLDYATAKAHGLHIGSGEIESALGVLNFAALYPTYL
jgi:hypothetical protein